MKEEKFSFLIDEEDITSPIIPERALLMAVLDRAYRDLDPLTEQRYHRHAIAWFRNSSKGSLLSFKYVIQHLELGYNEVKFLMDKVKLVEKIDEQNKCNSKGKEGREGISELVKGKIYKRCEKVTTIRRKRLRSNFGYYRPRLAS